MSGYYGLLNRSGASEHIINSMTASNIQAKGKGQISLGIKVDTQHPGTSLVKTADQRCGDGCFSDAALLIGNSNNLWQGIPPPNVKTVRFPLIFLKRCADKKIEEL